MKPQGGGTCMPSGAVGGCVLVVGTPWNMVRVGRWGAGWPRGAGLPAWVDSCVVDCDRSEGVPRRGMRVPG